MSAGAGLESRSGEAGRGLNWLVGMTGVGGCGGAEDREGPSVRGGQGESAEVREGPSAGQGRA